MTAYKFDLKWPPVGFPAQIDFGRIPGITVTLGPLGQPAFRLPAPFADLVIESGERLTEDKATRLREAAEAFGCVITRKEPTHG